MSLYISLVYYTQAFRESKGRKYEDLVGQEMYQVSNPPKMVRFAHVM